MEKEWVRGCSHLCKLDFKVQVVSCMKVNSVTMVGFYVL